MAIKANPEEIEKIKKAERKYKGVDLYLIKYGQRDKKKMFVEPLPNAKRRLKRTSFKAWYNLTIYKITKDRRKEDFEFSIYELMEMAMKN